MVTSFERQGIGKVTCGPPDRGATAMSGQSQELLVHHSLPTSFKTPANSEAAGRIRSAERGAPRREAPADSRKERSGAICHAALSGMASARRPSAECCRLGGRPFKRSVRPASSVNATTRIGDGPFVHRRSRGPSGRGPAKRGGCDKVSVGPSRISTTPEGKFRLQKLVQQAVAQLHRQENQSLLIRS